MFNSFENWVVWNIWVVTLLRTESHWLSSHSASQSGFITSPACPPPEINIQDSHISLKSCLPHYHTITTPPQSIVTSSQSPRLHQQDLVLEIDKSTAIQSQKHKTNDNGSA